LIRLLLLTAILAWPALPTGPVAAADFPVTLTDALGHAVTLETQPQRIVSMAPSNTEILFALGAGTQVAGVTTYCNYPPAAAKKPNVGEFSRSSLESIVSLNPDLVLAARFNPMEVLEGLRRLGIPVFALAPSRFTDILDTVDQIGRLSGHAATSDSLVRSMRVRVEAVRSAVATVPDSARPLVLWGRLKAPMYTAGPGGYLNDLINLAGGRNLAADARADWPQIGLETIVSRNPDVIIVSGGDSDIDRDLERLRGTGGWQGVQAVIQGRIYNVDPDLLQRPGPRIVQGLEQLCRVLHPGLMERHVH
jgi:iron complex transport system substrate-binding protein